MKQSPSITALCLAAGAALAPSVPQAALLGLTPATPTIDFSASGVISYDSVNGNINISGIPSTLFSTTPFIYGEIMGTGPDNVKDIEINFIVDAAGSVVAGDVMTPDLVITGSIDTNGDGLADYSGTLLTAEVSQFGFFDDSANGNDSFDLRLNNIGGDLAYLYDGQDLAISINSPDSPEYATPFNGSFDADWQAQAAGLVGSTSPVTSGGSGDCQINLVAECSVNGGDFKDKCRIKTSRSPKHWERHEYSHHGHLFYKSTYGMHGDPVPAWAANYPSSEVVFRYTVSNDGDTPISDIILEDSFDTPLASYPASLAVGDSFSVTRTIELHEGIENGVNVIGAYNANSCGATDVVVVKNKLRNRRRHDDDDYRDKGHR